jgi:hypothetical protein
MAVAAPGGRAHGDEYRVGAIDGGGQIGGEAQPPGGDVARHDLVEPGLVDRHLAAFEHGDLVGRLVDADDIMAEIRKAHPRNEADIARADHRNLHVRTETWTPRAASAVSVAIPSRPGTR